MRSVALVLVAALIGASCGPSVPPPAQPGQPIARQHKPGEAAARARAEHEASGEEPVSSKGKRWGGWRYKGAREECFYVVGRQCFEQLADACEAAKCKPARLDSCKVSGAGPATVSCK